LADGMGVDVSVSEWSLQADPARSRNASAMPLSSFFTIECYDSMRQRNQIYLERRTRPPANSKRAKAYAHKMRRSMNEHDVVHVKIRFIFGLRLHPSIPHRSWVHRLITPDPVVVYLRGWEAEDLS
jgi:hypothetical protein